MKKWFIASLCLATTTFADILVPLNANWSFLKGTAAPPEGWREVTFDATSWTTGPAPFYYDTALREGGTLLSDMRYNYTTVYLRRPFTVAEPDIVDRLALRTFIDDGFIVWINGREVARYNVAAGDPPFTGRAQAAGEPLWVTNSLSSPRDYLLPGQNTIAVQVLNVNLTSSDLAFDLHLESTSDTEPPAIVSIIPSPAKVSELTSVTITFSEAVQGVRAEDFLVNNSPATSVDGSGATYTFSFAQPSFGPIDITWDAGHQISDFADPPHPFDSDGIVVTYLLADETAPFVLNITPPANTTVRQLVSIDVQFSEAITNIGAGDLLIDGIGATNLIGRPANTYTFQFPAHAPGTANITWAAAHGIVDFATNQFVVENWSYNVDPNLPVALVYISEFLTSAENLAGLKDEDGDLQDWIELHNSGATAVNLGGWSLTDDPDEPGLWTFPSISIPAGGRLIVFASGKDRKPTSGGTRLHTSFKLGSGGEYLALFNADSPRIAMTEFADDYPEQRNDYSYGQDPNGAWRYYQVPTPGGPNGVSSISGVVPKPDVSHERGWHDEPFALTITNVLPGTTIRYTTDGNIPTEASGFVYSGPLQVSSNLVLRAAAFRPNHLPSEVVTHSYFFVEHVLRQPNNPAGFPATWGTHSGFQNNIVPADYEMDPEIVNDPAYAPEMVAALKALPIVSIALKTEDMFGAANGIYTHPLSRGAAWERPCSIEFIPLDRDDFQEDAGIQIQGNAAREPQKQPKHPMRVTFKGDYGAKRLDYQMFPDSPVTSFDTLILRADFNTSWLHWNPVQRVRGQRIRDAWMKDSMRDMGGLASHNRYVHLFINGLYWGIYDPTERPDGSFGEAYLGGDKEDYDVINEGAVVDGSMTAYNTMLNFTDLSSPAQYDAIKDYLEMTQFIDYMLLHFYVGHDDWFRNKNWYALRPKDGSRGFLYVPWDGELIMGELNANKVTLGDLPSDLHPKLIANAQYRLDFADRVHRHFFNNGALTPAANIARWEKRSAEIELPIIAESARWGDYRRDVHSYQNGPYELYTRDVQWRTERNRLLNSYFPSRTGTVLAQLRNAGLYPSIAAPVFSQHGGKVAPGYALQITGGAGTIYYTTDGTDPRVYHTGQISPQARAYTAPVSISASMRVKARVFSGGNWSALNEADFNTGSPRIPFRITELMYHPEPPGEAFEFIELKNLGSVPLDVSGYYIEGVDYIFPPLSVIAPGQFVVLGSAENPAAFAQRYPGLNVFGRFGGQLVNRGERVALVAANGRTIQSVDYDDDNGWPKGADGEGASLEIIDPLGDPDDPGNWLASANPGGSPGTNNSATASSPLRVNEVHATSDPDWLELFASESIDIGGWTLTEGNSTNVLVFPSIQLPASSYYTVAMGATSGAHDFSAPFALDADGEILILRDATGAVRDIFSFGPQAQSYSSGLISNRVELTRLTPGTANDPVASFSRSLVINELVADAVPGASDWIEIHNLDLERPASLRGLFLGLSNQLFEITSASFVAPGGYARFFADEQPGPNHVDFKLPAIGATVQLLDETGEVLDELSYHAQNEGASFGRYPDGSPTTQVFTYPTPKAANALGFPVAVTAASGEVVITWPSLVGRRYRIEHSDTLSDWQTLTEITAETVESTTREALSRSHRYYRVVAVQ